MVERLVESLVRYCPEVLEILVTKNIPETLTLESSQRIVIIDNPSPKGFGANHNAAFRLSHQPMFCPLNPDVELVDNPFPGLISAMNITGACLVAPIIKTPSGAIDNSIRRFPTLISLLKKFFDGSSGCYSITDGQADLNPEWVAGMFMLFRSIDYARLRGFDERYFLYYEDVDICVRAWKKNMVITACPKVSVIHDARRDSHRRFTHFRWHLASMARYFFKHWGRLPRVPSDGFGQGLP